MKLLESPWVLMGLALVTHIAGYLSALLSHSFEIPEIKFPEKEEKKLSVEEILQARSEDYNWYFKTEEIDKFVEELNEREEELDDRAASLKNLEAHLEIEREELEELKEEIERRHKALSDEILIVRESEARNLKNLATSYSSISPEAAVAIFNQMDEKLVLKILALMKPDVIAAIFEELANSGVEDPRHVRKAAEWSEALRLHYKETDKKD